MNGGRRRQGIRMRIGIGTVGTWIESTIVLAEAG